MTTPLTPTPFQQKFVNHCIALGKLDKAYANWAVKNYAQIDPFQLSKLRELIFQELKARAANE